MFGYIMINKPELKFREFDLYRSYYCGLCRSLKKECGVSGQLTLSYDMTFLVLMLTGLYEPQNQDTFCKCAIHPLERHACRQNKFSLYAADMNVLLTYYKCLDDWNDDHDLNKLVFAKMLSSNVTRIQKNYPEKAELIEQELSKLSKCEQEKKADLDEVSGLFGNITGELFVYQNDDWSEDLRKMGFYLGKFIYIADAYEDLEKDRRSGNYNPLLSYLDQPEFQEKCYEILTMMMAECCKSFERLPILQDIEILRNILYSGIWSRYNLITARRNKAAERKGRKGYQS
jgi:hypothetical protein